MAQKLKVLIADGSFEVRESLKKIFLRYTDVIEILEAANAEDTLRLIKLHKPMALLMEVWLDYCGAKKTLDPRNLDLTGMDAGLKLLNHLENSGLLPRWTSLMTTRRNFPASLNLKGRIYIKPFDDIFLEADLMGALGIPCQLPKGLLPDNYLSPTCVL